MLSKEDVLKIATLSKLEFSESEIEKFRVDLNKIFEHMEELNGVDTTDVEPLFNVLDLKDKLREDKVRDAGVRYYARYDRFEDALCRDSLLLIGAYHFGNSWWKAT